MKKKIITVLTLLMLSIIGITGFGINVKAECIGSVDLIEETKMTENVLYQHYQMSVSYTHLMSPAVAKKPISGNIFKAFWNIFSLISEP